MTHVVTGRTWGRTCINGSRFTLCADLKHAPGETWLFDHQNDPGLETDIAGDHPEIVAELQEAWQRWPPETARERAARTTRFKLVQRPQLDGSYVATLYELANDPAESIDVSDRYPDVRRELAAALDEWTSKLPPLGDRVFDPEVEELLRVLGYAG